ncbi:UDP-glucose 4-epimerase GalE [Thorsellia anophelis]|uniref:UDP-glucose 4-epimerase n=1 Tax=Thorsellia anophelis DSM 18579 TaxID=1123402 RepID=A0A1I0F4U5_9GAMM|nr:UDP-glucose 4-epimerase GalE [Thorsellia anophelis]SET52836.1 UDP-glucose 4-epimerase [Thorsellia anophelis DSM 18579]
MNILVTGGTGYIGSHTCITLIENKMNPIILDNLSNSKVEVLKRIETLTGKEPVFYQGDVTDPECLKQIFTCHKIDAVIHFAGLKAVGESVKMPLDYYQTNVTGTLTLLQAMKNAKVNCLLFSSTATVYGDPETVPLTELSPTGNTTNPYGSSKFMVEKILIDLSKTQDDLSLVILRYFNPVGAHSSGLIGEDPTGIPNNLMPYITQVAVGKRDKLTVFGNDYDTIDGTGVRDYIHVCDLAEGHVAALKALMYNKGLHVYNLGTGQGTSVLEMINAFIKTTNINIPYTVAERRQGDIATCFASTDKAFKELNWRAKRTIEDMTRDSWNWQSKNPDGF